MAPGVLVPEVGVREPVQSKKGQQLPSAEQNSYGSYFPVEPEQLSLESNYGAMQPGTVGYLQPTAADAPLGIMHERYRRDGYLFVSTSRLLLLCMNL